MPPYTAIQIIGKIKYNAKRNKKEGISVLRQK
jgi:hypothetical protein